MLKTRGWPPPGGEFSGTLVPFGRARILGHWAFASHPALGVNPFWLSYRDPDAVYTVATCIWWFPSLYFGVEKATCFQWWQNGDFFSGALCKSCSLAPKTGKLRTRYPAGLRDPGLRDPGPFAAAPSSGAPGSGRAPWLQIRDA